MQPRVQAAKALTLVEVIIAAALLVILAGTAMSLMQTTGQSSNLVFEKTRVQLDCQRVLKFLKDEMRRTSFGASGNLRYINDPAAGVDWELRYFRMDSASQIWSGGFDPDDPYAGTTVGWSANEFVIRLEIMETGTDTDRDYVFNESRLVFYEDVGGTLEERTLVGENIIALTVVPPTTPTLDDERPTISFVCTTERVLRTAIDDSNLADVLAGNRSPGHRVPLVQYTGDIRIGLRN